MLSVTRCILVTGNRFCCLPSPSYSFNFENNSLSLSRFLMRSSCLVSVCRVSRGSHSPARSAGPMPKKQKKKIVYNCLLTLTSFLPPLLLVSIPAFCSSCCCRTKISYFWPTKLQKSLPLLCYFPPRFMITLANHSLLSSVYRHVYASVYIHQNLML